MADGLTELLEQVSRDAQRALALARRTGLRDTVAVERHSDSQRFRGLLSKARKGETVEWVELAGFEDQEINAYFSAFQEKRRTAIMSAAFALAESYSAASYSRLVEAVLGYQQARDRVAEDQREFFVWKKTHDERALERLRDEAISKLAEVLETRDERIVNDQLRSPGAFIRVREGNVPRVNR